MDDSTDDTPSSATSVSSVQALEQSAGSESESPAILSSDSIGEQSPSLTEQPEQPRITVTMPPAEPVVLTAPALITVTKKQKQAAAKETKALIGQQAALITRTKEQTEVQRLLVYTNINTQVFGEKGYLHKASLVQDAQLKYLQSLQLRLSRQAAVQDEKEDQENNNPNTQ